MRRLRFIARQARNAHGVLGRLVAAIMAGETSRQNERAIEALGVSADDQVLDIGCGPGGGLAGLASRASRGHVTGVDPSHLMVKIAGRRNKALLEARRVDVVNADASRLPFADRTFDKALCVHVIYFWNDLGESLREIARVLKPGGRLALLFRSTAHTEAVRAFPSDVYRFRDLREVVAALSAAGFEVVGNNARGEEASALAPHLIIATRLG